MFFLGEIMKKLLFVLVLSAVTAQAGVFYDDFSAGIRSDVWSINNTTVGLYSVDDSHGDVRFAKINNTPGGFQCVGLALNMDALGVKSISGDFTMEVSFSGACISDGGLNQVELHSAFEDGTIFFNVRDYYSVHVWTGSYQTGFETQATSGTFKITRTGNLVSGYLDNALIWQTTYTTANLSVIEFALQNNNGSNDATSVTFDNFRLEAASIPEPMTIAILAFGSLLLARKKK
jgi:hypothetical protein